MSAGRMRVEEVTTVTYGGAPLAGPWPLSWSAVWVGALSAVSLGLVIGLAGIAIGAHHVGQPFASWKDVGLAALIFSVFGAFISFVAGGWLAARIAGLRRSESAMLHGAVVWVLAVPMLLLLASLGAAAYFGTWYGGLAGTPVWAGRAVVVEQDPTAAALAARTGALAALTSLLLGLVGGVIGGWMGSGEPMTFGYFRTRPNHARVENGGW